LRQVCRWVYFRRAFQVTEKMIETAPPGFELVPQGLGYIDTLQPVYRKVEGDRAIFGLVVGTQHTSRSPGYVEG
jgi:hypothetical protein